MRIVDLNEEPEFWPQFFGLPAAVYGDDPCYVKPPGSYAQGVVDRSTATAGGSLPLLALDRDCAPVARLVVILPEQLPVGEKDRVGMVGLFESLDHFTAVQGLFDQAGKWLVGKGIGKMVGPMDGDTWHKYRINIGPCHRPPFLMEPYNPPYYPKLWVDCGFTTLAGYYSKHIPDLSRAMAGLEKFYNRCLRNGFSFRPFRKRHFAEELDILYDLSCATFADNFYYLKITRDSFKGLYAGAGAIILEKLIWFALDKSGQYCGFSFALPDYHEAVRSLGGKTDIWSKLRFLYNRRKANTLNAKSVGVLKQYQGSGLGPALTYKAYLEGYRHGFPAANLCLIHEANSSGRLDADQGEVSRRYLLYEKPLLPAGGERP